jgi:hypothetical protein
MTGETYKNVKVLSHDAAYVTILHEDGGGKIALSTLPPDLQKRFGYDAAKAAAVIAAQKAADQANRVALANEKARIEALREKAAADALTVALFTPPPDADVPPAGTPSNPPQPGLVAGYETPYPPEIDYGNYGDWGYGYGYPIVVYGGYGAYGYRGYGSYHGGWNRSYGTRSFSPGFNGGATGYSGRR